jgi:hypothetical protein
VDVGRWLPLGFCEKFPPTRGYTSVAMKISRLILLGLAASLIAVPLMAQTGNCKPADSLSRPDCPDALAFFRSIQSALRENDRQTVASLVSYPILVTVQHKHVHIRNRAQLLDHFDEIFDEGVRCSILNADEKKVWGNWRGFTVGDGAVWFDGVIPPGEVPDMKKPEYSKKYPFKIIAINNDAHYPCSTPAKERVTPTNLSR